LFSAQNAVVSTANPTRLHKTGAKFRPLKIVREWKMRLMDVIIEAFEKAMDSGPSLDLGISA